MNMSIPSTARFLTRMKHGAGSKPERVEGIHLQEQVAGPRPVRNERLAADILAERLAESGSIFPAAPVFVP